MRIRGRRALRRARADSGITTLQVLIMFPIMVFVIGLSIQEALNYYAKQVALEAAQQGVDAVRFGGVTGKTPAALASEANAAASAYLAKHGGNLLTNVTITPAFIPADPVAGVYLTDQYKVTVTGQSLSLIGGLNASLNQQVTGPIEEFTVGWG